MAGAAVALLAAGASAQTPHFSLWVTEVNDVPCPSCPTQNLPATEVSPGDQIRVEAFLESWDDVLDRGVCSGSPPQFGQVCTNIGSTTGCAGSHCSDSGTLCTQNANCISNMCVPSTCIHSPRVGSVQWTLDSASLVSGTSGSLSIARIPCDPLDCEVLTDGTCPCAQFYQFSSQCTCAVAGSCELDGFCFDQGSAFVEKVNPNYIFFGLQTIEGITTTTDDYEFALVLFQASQGVIDPGPGLRRYIGTLLLDVSPNAAGTFELRMVDHPERTFANDARAVVIEPRTLAPALIHLPNPCPGVDCNDNNPCTTDSIDLSDCTCDNVPVTCPPGQTCNPANGLCETSSTCTAVVSMNPPNCEIDARQPHDLTNAGIIFGETTFQLTFNAGCVASTLSPASFTVSTAPGPAPAPAIQSVVGAGNVATVTLNAAIPVSNWTCITHVASGDDMCFGYLPGDVNRSRGSTAADINALINSLNNVPGFVRPLFATDANRSGAANASDILRVIDLLNGAQAFDPWLNKTLPVCPSQ